MARDARLVRPQPDPRDFEESPGCSVDVPLIIDERRESAASAARLASRACAHADGSYSLLQPDVSPLGPVLATDCGQPSSAACLRRELQPPQCASAWQRRSGSRQKTPSAAGPRQV